MNNNIAKQIVAIADSNRAWMMGSAIPGCLVGSNAATARQQVMQLATGQKIPKAKCGVCALESALQSALAIDNQGCLSATRDAIDSTLRTMAGAA